ncbi:MAG: hypothetical protein ACRESS_00400 [Stenotrophobium sp.]
MTTRARFESQLQKVQKRVSAETAKRKKQIASLRAKAAEAALHWVMSHEDRVNAFRSSVKGTPVAKALDSLIDKLKSSSGAMKKKPARKSAAKKKPAARKKTAAKRKA